MHNDFELQASETPIKAAKMPPVGEAEALNALRRWLEAAGLRPGDRLPPERALARMLSHSRPELRKALAVLHLEGRITRHVGRGTFVADRRGALLTPSALRALTDRADPGSLLSARLVLEPELAHLAALHATPEQIRTGLDIVDEMRAVTGWENIGKRETALHDLIAESAGNPLLHALYGILQSVAYGVDCPRSASCRSAPSHPVVDTFDALLGAIARRDPEAARTAMETRLRTARPANASTKGPSR